MHVLALQPDAVLQLLERGTCDLLETSPARNPTGSAALVASVAGLREEECSSSRPRSSRSRSQAAPRWRQQLEQRQRRRARTPATTVAITGDSPYSTTQLAQWPTLIDGINSDPDVGLVVHLPGTSTRGRCSPPTSGTRRSTTCSKPSPTRSSTRPVTTSGRTATGRRKARRIRSRSWRRSARSSSRSRERRLGGVPKQVTWAAFPENVMWAQSNVVFATIDLPGSNNDLVPWYSGRQPGRRRDAAPGARGGDANRRRPRLAPGRVLARQGGAGLRNRDRHASGHVEQRTTPGRLRCARRSPRSPPSSASPSLLLEGDSHMFTADHPIATAPNVTRIVISRKLGIGTRPTSG